MVKKYFLIGLFVFCFLSNSLLGSFVTAEVINTEENTKEFYETLISTINNDFEVLSGVTQRGHYYEAMDMITSSNDSLSTKINKLKNIHESLIIEDTYVKLTNEISYSLEKLGNQGLNFKDQFNYIKDSDETFNDKIKKLKDLKHLIIGYLAVFNNEYMEATYAELVGALEILVPNMENLEIATPIFTEYDKLIKKSNDKTMSLDNELYKLTQKVKHYYTVENNSDDFNLFLDYNKLIDKIKSLIEKISDNSVKQNFYKDLQISTESKDLIDTKISQLKKLLNSLEYYLDIDLENLLKSKDSKTLRDLLLEKYSGNEIIKGKLSKIEGLDDKIKKLQDLLKKSKLSLDKLNTKLSNRKEQINSNMKKNNYEKILLKGRSLDKRIYIMGSNIEYDVPPMIKEGRTLVPLRAITEGLGANVVWDKENSKVIITRDNKVIELFIGSNKTYVDGSEHLIDVPAEIYNGRTFVPLRFIGESLNEDVSYNSENGDIDVGLETLRKGLELFSVIFSVIND